ncbi:NAT_SF domain containing protein [Candidatus Nanopelagicaceae bacterium]
MRTDFAATRAAYASIHPDSPFFDTWVPEEKFLNAEFDEEGNFVISREDDGIYGLALGENPSIPAEWKNFSIESRGIQKLPAEFQAVVEWDCYWAPTIAGSFDAGKQSTDEEINKFLKSHAPDSSVYPGNDEILQWIQLHDNGELVAVAALCRWQSGRVVISSVATHSQHRGKGFGKTLMKNCLIAGAKLGEKYLSLGVRHENESAQRLYASMGFGLMHNFTYCERR